MLPEEQSSDQLRGSRIQMNSRIFALPMQKEINFNETYFKPFEGLSGTIAKGIAVGTKRLRPQL